MLSQEKQALTLGQIAERLNVSTHQVKYAVDQYRILPHSRVGIIRVWSEDDLPKIKSALARIAGNRGWLR
jgi:DNA-binding transcriptional MerR regulator